MGYHQILHNKASFRAPSPSFRCSGMREYRHLHFRLNEPNDPISSNHNQVCQSRVSSSDYYLKSSMSAWYWNSRDRSLVMASCHSGQCQVHRQIFSKVKRLRHRHLLNLQSQDLYHHALCVNKNATHVYIKIHLYACIPTSNLQTSVNFVGLKLSQIWSGPGWYFFKYWNGRFQYWECHFSQYLHTTILVPEYHSSTWCTIPVPGVPFGIWSIPVLALSLQGHSSTWYFEAQEKDSRERKSCAMLYV